MKIHHSFTKWMYCAIVFCIGSLSAGSLSLADDLPPPQKPQQKPEQKIEQSQLAIQWHESSGKDSQGLQKVFRVIVKGSGKAEEFSNVKSKIEKELEATNWPVESRTEAVSAILSKLEEVTQGKEEWSGRVEWSSANPGAATTHFQEITNGDESTQKEGSEIRNRMTERLNKPVERARTPAELFAQNALEMQKNFDRLQRRNNNANNMDAPKYRLGIDCRIILNGVKQPPIAGEGSEDSSASKPVFEIESVLKDSPAELAGLQPGDKVQLINGLPMESIEHLVDSVQVAGQQGEKLVLEVVRNDDHLEFELEPTVIAELNFNNMEQSLPFRMFGNGFPNPIPNNFQQPNNIPGFRGPFGPGWVMNREEMNQLQNLAEQANQDAQRSMERGNTSKNFNQSEIQEELSSLRNDVAELKSMLSTILEKLKNASPESKVDD